MSTSNPFFESFDNTSDNEVIAVSTETASSFTNTESKSDETTPSISSSTSSPFMNDSNPFDSISNFSNNSQSYNNTSSKKYYIRDNYWFINTKLWRKEKMDDNECPCITISFNSQYDNLRIVFLNPSRDAFNSNSVIRSKCKVITTANVFAETCEALLYYYDRSIDKPITHLSLERLIQANSEWKPNTTKFDLDKKNNRITILTSPTVANAKSPVYKFTFEEYQTEGFLNVCQFMRKEAWLISNIGQFLINNNS